MKEAKKMGRPRNTAEGGKNYTFYLSREVGEKVKELGGARWIREQAYKSMTTNEETKMNKQIENQVSEYRNNGICLYIHDNGQPKYFDVKTMCDFAMIDFEEKDGEVVAVLLDDGNKRVNIISVDQLDDLIAKQTEHRGNFYETKDDALKDLDYMLNSENIDKNTYDELVEELNKLKF